MKATLLKIYIFSFLFMTDFAAFAQPGTDDGGGGLKATILLLPLLTQS